MHWIGPAKELHENIPTPSANHEIKEIDCTGKTVLPGFVDPHTHLVFGGSREEEFAMRCAGKSYQEISAAGGGIKSTVKSTREQDDDTLKKEARL